MRRRKTCWQCKHWVRIETGCIYGTCCLNLDGIWRSEGDSCEKFEVKSEQNIKEIIEAAAKELAEVAQDAQV